ncbi:uncharacterized protein BYT42DRAFT_578699 [Radiomyces spectabilis]|uniref:uncharacterized protein n=1 Tax=Radiomyces spectabilis TaxID=64574 RepID=UPI00221F88EB|nr:uncharacterized protein BYT42DRAFT_578699 [Radiomyces spectabilis]KAI8372953.1 hypothetical protein BYT42DRAFT_578699 [Radiomyces spectabilis]
MPSHKKDRASALTEKPKSGMQAKKRKHAPDQTDSKTMTLEQVLHASWKFIYVYQFLSVFASFLNLPGFDIGDLENALLTTCQGGSATKERAAAPAETDADNGTTDTYQSSQKLVKTVITQLLSPLVKGKTKASLRTDNYTDALEEFLTSKDATVLEEIDKTGATIFEGQPIHVMIDILKFMADQTFDHADEMRLHQWKTNQYADDLRSTPLGQDEEGRTYWVVGGARLYRELPLPKGKKGISMLNQSEYTFELVCKTAADWREWVDKFSVTSRRVAEKRLAQALQDVGLPIIHKLEKMEADQLRKEAKLKRARELEQMSRKRSRRLEVKYEQQAEQQKKEETQKQIDQMLAYEKAQELKQQRRKEEQEKRDLVRAEAKLKEDVYNIIDPLVTEAVRELREKFKQDQDESMTAMDSKRMLELKELRCRLRKHPSAQERLEKMQGWASLLDDDHIIYVTLSPCASTMPTPNEEMPARCPLPIWQVCSVKGPGCKLQRLNSPLLKSILGNYLLLLQSHDAAQTLRENVQTDGSNQLTFSHMYKKLLLDRYVQDEDGLPVIQEWVYDLFHAFDHLRSLAGNNLQVHKEINKLNLYAQDLLFKVFPLPAVP